MDAQHPLESDTSPAIRPVHPDASPLSLSQRYGLVRQATLSLVASLSAEDMVVQSMPDASPVKWHLGHTAWFFETFLLDGETDYRRFDASFSYLFNSYYEALGPRQPRPLRGLLTRPALDQVIAYRAHVDAGMEKLLTATLSPQRVALVELGIAHEQQHQELILMDVLHLLAQSPLKPAYSTTADALRERESPAVQSGFLRFEGGLVEIGHAGADFHFDNEGPRHKTFLQPFEIADNLVTNGDWLRFMEAGGYTSSKYWLSEGWSTVQTEGWIAPLYWEQRDGDWLVFGLNGLHPIELTAPVAHISYYEAAAYAAWAAARLPTESEWEHAAASGKLQSLDRQRWQWTQSAYLPYPGFKVSKDAVGEYNGKFMVGQMVLRGSASVTPPGHSRLTYRNFFHPDKRWMFSGLRLARDISIGSAFANDVLEGLSQTRKSISPKYFYDSNGSDLFEAICETPEYYPTRTELALLNDIAREITTDWPSDAALVEFGSGASLKTIQLLKAAPSLPAYVPIDISASALTGAQARLHEVFPDLHVSPVEGDFTQNLVLPLALTGPRIGFFPGSTIGNFTRSEAVAFLANARTILGKGARFIVGADLVKAEEILLRAYDDAAGVTAAFNKNLLARMNRELNANFNLQAFDHLAEWNAEAERIEMHLVSTRDQIVKIAGHVFAFQKGEHLHTENSHKFTIGSFTALAKAGGWQVARQWVSESPSFAVFELVSSGSAE